MSELNQGCCAAKPAFVADGVNVAVVGATGQVGRVMCAMLDQRDFPVKSLRLFSSARSAGSVVTWRGQDITVEDVANTLFFLSNDQGALTGQSLRLTHGWAMM